jgi:ABC-type nickel/cobalt efflux system permease component RcnA
MSAVVGAVATAAALGVTHAIEPDHVAGVASVTGRYGDRRLSAIVGACFAAGHVALVVAWLAVGYVVLGQTDFGSIYDVVGTAGVALLLGVLGTAMTIGGLQSVVHAHEHAHGEDMDSHDDADGHANDDAHSHYHVHLPFVGAAHGHDSATTEDAQPTADDAHAHDHTVRRYLLTGVVGALFTLSPPLSMLAFVAVVLPEHGPGAVALAVLAYTVGIAGTMGALGAGVGTLFDTIADRPRTYAAARTVAGLLVLAVAASLVV